MEMSCGFRIRPHLSCAKNQLYALDRRSLHPRAKQIIIVVVLVVVVVTEAIVLVVIVLVSVSIAAAEFGVTL
jgi:hypothetical protein